MVVDARADIVQLVTTQRPPKRHSGIIADWSFDDSGVCMSVIGSRRGVAASLLMALGELPAWRSMALALACVSLAAPASVASARSAAGEVLAEAAKPPPEIATDVEAGATTVMTDKDMAVTANPLASKAAAAMLARGGSAVDAAIAAQMVLNLVEPQSSGIGGGAFLLVFNERTRRLRVFDGRETAPAGVDETLFSPDGKPLKFAQAIDSGLSVGVPGLLRMLDLAHRGHGQLPWAELFRPAIELAEKGFAVSPRLHASIVAAHKRIERSPSAAAYFLDAKGKPLAAGSILKNPALAASLREIAEHGADRFYSGQIARNIVAAVQEHPLRPGAMTVDDLAGYRALEREPLCGEYRRFRICGAPAPTSGGITLLQALGILEAFDMSVLKPDSARAVHLIAESQRLAYADRARYISDPEFAPVPTSGMLNRDYLRARARLISHEQSMGVPLPGEPEGAPKAGPDKTAAMPSTTHLSIVDQSGNAVSMTSSIEHAFGSMIMVDGFLLNNQLTDFSFTPEDADGEPVMNRVQAGKRPRSSMAPTMVFDRNGNLEGVVGSPGGSSIIQYVMQALVGMIDWKLNPIEAIAAPHFGAQTSAVTTLEADTPLVRLQPALTALGHKTRVRPQTSGTHLIVFNGVRADGQTGGLAAGLKRSRWAGAADPRREGVVAGR